MAELQTYRWDDMPAEDLKDGLRRRLITGDQVMVTHVYFTKGTEVPRHEHHNEQITYILEGALEFHFGPDGEVHATYRKMHMFDVEVGGRTYRESDHEQPGDDIVLTRTADGTELGIDLVAGSIVERREGRDKFSNTCVHVSPDGDVHAVYRKIHMFDVEVGGVVYRESDVETPGEDIVVADAGELKLGLAVCYDLRFPELFRIMAVEGAQAFTLPSAFTVPTGRAHWEILIRARAIENQAFVIAAGQVGRHQFPAFRPLGALRHVLNIAVSAASLDSKVLRAPVYQTRRRRDRQAAFGVRRGGAAKSAFTRASSCWSEKCVLSRYPCTPYCTALRTSFSPSAALSRITGTWRAAGRLRR